MSENEAMDKKNKIMDIVREVSFALLIAMLTLEIGIVIVDKSNFLNPYEGQLFRVCFLLCVFRIVLTKRTVKEWICLVAFGLLGLVSWCISGRNEILRIVVFVAACRGVERKQLLSYVFGMTAAGCALLVILSVTGIYGELYGVTDFGRGIVQTRYSLGMGHPNALHCMFLMLTVLGIYTYKDNIKWWHYLVLGALNYGLFLLTDSRTGVAITMCAIFGSLFFSCLPKANEVKAFYVLGALAFLACIVFSVLVASPAFVKPDNHTFGNIPVVLLDWKLNGRIYDLHYGTVCQAGTTPTWHLFSTRDAVQFFDMGFARMFYWYGVIPGIIYVIMILLLLWQMMKQKDGLGLVAIVVLSVYTVLEAHLVSEYTGRNYIWLIFALYIRDILGTAQDDERYLWKLFGRIA